MRHWSPYEVFRLVHIDKNVILIPGFTCLIRRLGRKKAVAGFCRRTSQRLGLQKQPVHRAAGWMGRSQGEEWERWGRGGLE